MWEVRGGGELLGEGRLGWIGELVCLPGEGGGRPKEGMKCKGMNRIVREGTLQTGRRCGVGLGGCRCVRSLWTVL